MKPFDKILVANRGEIARRVLRTARSLGYATVAVYSEADADAPHVREADEAICIGPPTSSESYLNVDAILTACARTGAQAVHPGYGFLSENAAFAEALAEAGLTFIGPPAEAIRLMGSKAEAKRRMIEAGVPCVPGYHGEDQSLEAFAAQADAIGYPVMVKASAGGGGRGMRLVEAPGELERALEAARSEATSAFGDGELLLEKAILHPRHVEIQVFADMHGEVVHLGERDCSIQRRHQKVIEEAPSPAMTPDLRERMGEAAVSAALAIGYVGAGTVEFLLGADGQFYFLEMNTRLQVEHPVTELITGQDLVAWQLEVANGAPLPLTQEQVELSGHAIEARLYAEDPYANFLPQTGEVRLWRPPAGEGVRVDDGLESGFVISPYYDPMIAKIIARGRTREQARRRLTRALERCVALGAVTNRAFLIDCLTHEVFRTGEATTSFIAEHLYDDADALARPEPSDEEWASLAALLSAARRVDAPRLTAMWSSTGETTSLMKLEIGAQQREARVRCTGPWRFEVELEDEDAVSVQILARDGAAHRVEVAGVQRDVDVDLDGEVLHARLGAHDWRVEDVLRRPVTVVEGADGKISAPMTGKILTVEVEPGQRVEAGDRLAILEAMKMEHNITTPVAGEVTEITCAEGEQIEAKALLFAITPDEEG